MYAGNHRASPVYLLSVVAVFIVARYRLYGPPHGFSGYALDIGIMLWGLVFLLLQRRVYKNVLEQADKLDAKSIARAITNICLNRLLYMLPWLFLLFSPLKSDLLYTHLLGYIFVFTVTSTYASASAPMLGMMLYDIGLPMICALAVTFMNWHVQETPYIGGALLMFSCYVYFIGLKMHNSTQQLIDSKYQLQKSARRAEEANRAKSSFLALMSHEIRTPMTGISGMIDFLKETNLTDEQKDFVVTIRECSKTLLNTLNDILDFSKVESGKLAISKINFDYPAMLGNSATIMRQLADDKGLVLDLVVGKNVPRIVHGDPHRLQQAVMNLLNNAVKFTEKGGVTLHASFSEETSPPVLRVEVKDTGIGMTKESMANLFRAFSQADSSISRRYGGTGLGLSIAKSLIELMGGRIGCSSEPDKGSTFWFEVPYEQPVADPAAPHKIETQAQTPPLRILVVEDNAINLRIVVRLLTHRGHTVTSAVNAEEAIASVKSNEFDMILMDVNMPGKSGIDATRSIRAMGKQYRRIPIVALTANIMDEHIIACRDAGMNGHIAKPFSPDELFEAIAFHYLRGKTKENTGTKAKSERTAHAAKTMEQVLNSIREELGTEYLRQMVEGNVRESERLMTELKSAFKTGDTDKLVAAAHDMKSVCGLIGMQKTSQSAAALETSDLQRPRERLEGVILRLEALRRSEAQQASELSVE